MPTPDDIKTRIEAALPGANAEVEALAGASTQVIDLDGRTAMPGLTDCHVHLASDSSRAVESVECRDLYDPSIDSVEALVMRLEQWAASTPPGQWIVARGSPLADFRLHERRLPTRAELDTATGRNPAYISFGAHVIIANTLALRLDRVRPPLAAVFVVQGGYRLVELLRRQAAYDFARLGSRQWAAADEQERFHDPHRQRYRCDSGRTGSCQALARGPEDERVDGEREQKRDGELALGGHGTARRVTFLSG